MAPESSLSSHYSALSRDLPCAGPGSVPPEVARMLPDLLALVVEDHGVLPTDTDPENLARFVAARKGNVQAAAALLANYWRFRRTQAGFPDSLRFRGLPASDADPDVRDVILRDGFVELQGRTRDGGLIMVLRSAKGFPYRLERGPLSIMRGIYHALEIASFDPATQALGLTVVNDCRGAGLANAHSGLVRHIPSVFRDRFPLRVAKYYVLDPPSVFPVIWKVIKVLVGQKLASKLKVVGIKAMRDEIGEAGLGEEYGGTWTGPSALESGWTCGTAARRCDSGVGDVAMSELM